MSWTSQGLFLDFIDDTMVWFLSFRLGLGLSCAGGFRGLVSAVTWCVVCSDGFSARFVGVVSNYRGIGYEINVLQRTACLVVGPIRVGNFAFLFGCTPVGRALGSVVVPAWGLVW